MEWKQSGKETTWKGNKLERKQSGKETKWKGNKGERTQWKGNIVYIMGRMDRGNLSHKVNSIPEKY